MREFAVGDIHGCAGAFGRLLELVRPTPEDTFVLLGDYVDRGPDSCGVIEMILELEKTCQVIALMGNHEKMLLQSRSDLALRQSWLTFGGQATLDSYRHHSHPGSGLGVIPPQHWQFFAEQTVPYWETDDTIYVHASLDPDLDLEDQTENELFWRRLEGPIVHKSGKRMICGHTSQQSGLPVVFENGLCLDTWAYGGGWLTCFEKGTEMFLQARQSGQHRSFDLRLRMTAGR